MLNEEDEGDGNKKTCWNYTILIFDELKFKNVERRAFNYGPSPVF